MDRGTDNRIRRSRWPSGRGPDGRGHDDAGTTLIETLIALMIIGIVLSGLGGTLVMTVRTVHESKQDVQASGLRNRALEQLRAVPWDLAGFCAGEQDSSHGTPVVLGPEQCADPRRPVATETISLDGTTFNVIKHVVEGPDADSDGTPDDRRIVVEVAWDDQKGTNNSRGDAVRWPSPNERGASGCGGAIGGPDIAILQAVVMPDPILLDQVIAVPILGISSGVNANPVNVSLTTCGLAVTDDVKLTVYQGDNREDVVLASKALVSLDGTVWMSSQVAGALAMVEGDAEFVFSAKRPATGEVVQFVVPVVAQVPALTLPVAVSIEQVTVGQNPVCVNSQNELSADLVISAVVGGLADHVQVKFTHGTFGTQVATERLEVLTAASGLGLEQQFSKTIPAGTKVFNPALQASFTVTASRSDGSSDGSTPIVRNIDPC